ncbi:MAG TPA: nucleoside hydrolase [Bryobacteraceae bacterium]|nr:nucleoside hydrolase [Bryobacteraceae bacterium]
MLRKAALMCPFVLIAVAAWAQQRPLLIDTDAGSDDLMAIAFLLSQPGVRIEAVTVVNGLAHPEAGAHNVARLLELAGRGDVPVFAGRHQPLRGDAEFPAEWRKIADQLPGVTLPAARRRPEARPAADYLIERLRHPDRPVRILALGPLTNLAEALRREPSAAKAIEEIAIMGGAIHVPGNLADGGLFKTSNKTAEWNIFVDPMAARIVFRSGIPIRLIALDATNTVPIHAEFLREFESHARTPLGRFVAQVLQSDHEAIEQGFFYAWDPLAAVALLDPGVVKLEPLHIEIREDAPEEGRTAIAPGRPNARVALRADGDAFRRLFLGAFEH